MKKYSITKEQISLEDGSVLDFILDIGDRKNMYLCVKDGKVILKIPYGEPKDKAFSFLLSKAEWIKKNLNATQKPHGFCTYENGESISLLGKTYTLRLVKTDIYSEPYFEDDNIIVSVNENTPKERIIISVNKLITDFAVNKINDTFKRLCEKTGLYPQKITVKRMKSRWGSCSSEGNISINFDIIYRKPECLEYVAIHELCHLKHMNHSKDFWELVEKYCPDRKRIRKELNEK
ncbi:MAG: M48 family metallopeptidase [Oscillospiraceae bacterium]